MSSSSLFNEALDACYAGVRNDDRRTWWPKVVRADGPTTVLDVDGRECVFTCRGSPSGSGGSSSDFEVGNANALFRLMADGGRTCALYAYPAECGIRPVDAIVGFLGGEADELALACDNERVFPMIGGRGPAPEIPPGARWIVAAAFQTGHRHAVGLELSS